MKEYESIIHYDRIGDSDMFNCHEVGQLVRCKDCKWCHSGYCEKAGDLIPFGLGQYEWEDWYCAWGKRKDEVEE